MPRLTPPRVVGVLVLVALLGGSLGITQTSQPATAPLPTATAPSLTAPTPAALYGRWVLMPPLVTIVLAIIFRQVIPALTLGILLAAIMVVQTSAAGPLYGDWLGGIKLAVERYLIERSLADTDHIKVLVFTMTIGGLVGIMAISGGTAALVERVGRWARTRRRGQLSAGIAGLVVFFDDYANAMIIGPSMRPITDRLQISRAKLAYIVDSTAAPVASLALIGTWVGAEIGYIQSGLDAVTQRPAFLNGITGYSAFLQSIPYRFYANLALVLVFVVALLGRDFGPMRREENAVASADYVPPSDAPGRAPSKSWYAVVPVLILLLGTIALLVGYGWPAEGFADSAWEAKMPPEMGSGLTAKAAYVLENTDPYNSILYGALAATVAAVVIALLTRSAKLGETVDGATATISRMFPTFLVLVLAWAFSAVMQDLQLGAVATSALFEAHFPPVHLPLLVFVVSCVVAFATGTSWGTMGILCPAVVTIAAGLLADMPPDRAVTLFYAAVGAVLAGAVFGDHCSPISDTTVLSALATECSLETHVWTQLPYALLAAGVSIVAGYYLCLVYGLHVGWSLLAGTALLLLIVLVFGRRPRASRDWKATGQPPNPETT